jgi:murein DD-endopeptidase MepM/ murein hydrolase activator NlpD
MLYPCDISKCIVTCDYDCHKARPGYKGTLAYDIASIGGKNIPIVSPIDGNVTVAGMSSVGYGNEVYVVGAVEKIQVAHLDSITVQKKAEVKAGDLLGYMGTTGNSTGVHVHFAVWLKRNNAWVNVDMRKEGIYMTDKPTPAQEPAVAGQKAKLRDCFNYVNIRSGAGVQHKILGRLLPGDEVHILKIEGDWANVFKVTELELWISVSYLTRVT